MTTPSEALAAAISSLLVQRGLFLEEDAIQTQTKFATGAMKSEDWLLAAEKALEKDASR